MNQESYKLLTIDVTESRPKGLGQIAYKTHPRVGEWVELEVDEKGVMFEVVMVAHSSRGGGSDLYVRRRGATPDAIHSLCGKAAG